MYNCVTRGTERGLVTCAIWELLLLLLLLHPVRNNQEVGLELGCPECFADLARKSRPQPLILVSSDLKLATASSTAFLRPTALIRRKILSLETRCLSNRMEIISIYLRMIHDPERGRVRIRVRLASENNTIVCQTFGTRGEPIGNVTSLFDFPIIPRVHIVVARYLSTLHRIFHVVFRAT